MKCAMHGVLNCSLTICAIGRLPDLRLPPAPFVTAIKSAPAFLSLSICSNVSSLRSPFLGGMISADTVNGAAFRISVIFLSMLNPIFFNLTSRRSGLIVAIDGRGAKLFI